ncbi:MAG TPA: hypothetical protein PK048_01020 [Candidatus Absconditabacterales bacterium]|nr:hypothetical protein [Candidatus Absconditabacterales bacterium]
MFTSKQIFDLGLPDATKQGPKMRELEKQLALQQENNDLAQSETNLGKTIHDAIATDIANAIDGLKKQGVVTSMQLLNLLGRVSGVVAQLKQAHKEYRIALDTVYTIAQNQSEAYQEVVSEKIFDIEYTINSSPLEDMENYKQKLHGHRSYGKLTIPQLIDSLDHRVQTHKPWIQEYASNHYLPSEYPLDGTTERGRKILGIRANFFNGIKRSDVEGIYLVDHQRRNEKIIDIGNRLINQGLFKIHQVFYNGHTIPVFSIRQSVNDPRVSRTTTQHMISPRQAKERNKKNTDKPQIKNGDYMRWTPGKNIDYQVPTMHYDAIKNRSQPNGTTLLPYGDHLQNMAKGIGTGGVTIEVECTPNGYIESTVLPLLQTLTGYTNYIVPGILHNVFGVMQYFMGGAGQFYYNDINLCVYLHDDNRCSNYDVNVDCALFAKVTWPTSPEGEEIKHNTEANDINNQPKNT